MVILKITYKMRRNESKCIITENKNVMVAFLNLKSRQTNLVSKGIFFIKVWQL
jgi:hypothetical protein